MINFHKLSSKISILSSGVVGVIIGITFVLLFQYAVKAQPEERQQTVLQDKVESNHIVEDSFFDNGDPFAAMEKMREKMLKGFGQFDDLSDNFFGAKNSGFSNRQSYSLNQKETNESLIYEINLKDGVDGKSVDIKVENGLVTISGQTKTENEAQDEVQSSFFSSSSSFSQSFSLPEYVDTENVRIKNHKNKIILTFPKIS